jgi:PAS domain S-box-containing protein
MLPVGLEAALSELGKETRPAAAIAPDGRYLDANAAFLGLLGLTVDELRSHRVGDFTPAELRASTLERWKRWVDGDPGPIAVEATVSRADARSMRVAATALRLTPELILATISPLDDAFDVPPERNASVVLSEWREAERELDASAHSSDARQAAIDRTGRLRREYADIFERERSREAGQI